jgi:hypothetical protein
MSVLGYPELIQDADAFLRLRREGEGVLAMQSRLPDQVFRLPFRKYWTFEHAGIYRDEFAIMLTHFAEVFSDSAINYMSIEPDPVEYYYEKVGFYGLASFEPTKLIGRFLSVMDRGGSADSFRARGGDVGALWGSSRRWGIFCDRISWELCVIGCDWIEMPVSGALKYMDMASVADYVTSQYRGRPELARDFITRFAANYPNGS